MEEGHLLTLAFSIVSSMAVGLSGVIPLLFIRFKTISCMEQKDVNSMNRWLSYATGSLLGEVFIHILPETWSHSKPGLFYCRLSSSHLFSGLLFFFFIEKLFSVNSKDSDMKIEGYLNLFANVVDNFTHGMAIGGSYLTSLRLGILTTICILIHEIPHEMGDFVILLRSGFTRWQAVKGQLLTASGSILGSLTAIVLDGAVTDMSIIWILPFTAGGFLYIALVSLLPDLLSDSSLKHSLIHLLLIFCGILSMLAVAMLLD